MTDKKQIKEPLFHIVKRDGMPVWITIIIYAVAITASIFLVSLFCAVTSQDVDNPLMMFSSLLDGAFGTKRRIWVFFRDTALLLGVSLALLPAFKMKFWNLGANGQIVIAALVTYWLMRWGRASDIPLGAAIPLMVVSGVGAGIVWAIIPAIFKAFFRTNETLFTLMMNYIAQGLVSVMIIIWDNGRTTGTVSPIDNYAIPELFNPFLLTIVIVSVLTVVMYFYLTHSKHGYELSLVGESENTAKYAGINIKKVAIRTLALSGAICGIIGVLLAGSINHNVSEVSHNNMGFTAIMTVWLANFNPLITIGTCVLITFISSGMGQVKQDFGFTNDAIANVALGITYFFIIACFFFINYKIVFRKSQNAVDAKGGETK